MGGCVRASAVCVYVRDGGLVSRVGRVCIRVGRGGGARSSEQDTKDTNTGIFKLISIWLCDCNIIFYSATYDIEINFIFVSYCLKIPLYR